MHHYIHQAYTNEDVSATCKKGLPQQHVPVNIEPIIQLHQKYRDPADQQQICGDHLIPLNDQIYRGESLQQHALINRSDDIQQQTAYREVHQEKQQPSPQPETDAHMCGICNKTCKSKRELEAHNAGHFGEKSDICHKAFERKKDLQRHMTHTREKHHKCEVCKRSFTLKGNLKRHILIHTGQKPHVCDICQRGFVLKYNLTTHYMTHTGQKNHICKICKKSFSRKSNLSSHYRVHSADREDKRKKVKKTAEEAEKQDHPVITKLEDVEQNVSEVDQQQKEVEMDQNVANCYEINLVENGGSREQDSILYENIGPSENSESFARIDRPLTHILQQQKQPTRKKSHVCDICHKSFTRKECVRRHNLTHTGKKPHECEVCHRGFAQKIHLQKHNLIHTRVKSYKCEVLAPIVEDQNIPPGMY